MAAFCSNALAKLAARGSVPKKDAAKIRRHDRSTIGTDGTRVYADGMSDLGKSFFAAVYIDQVNQGGKVGSQHLAVRRDRQAKRVGEVLPDAAHLVAGVRVPANHGRIDAAGVERFAVWGEYQRAERIPPAAVSWLRRNLESA